MQNNRRRFITTTAIAASSIALPRMAWAQAFPARTIRYICP